MIRRRRFAPLPYALAAASFLCGCGSAPSAPDAPPRAAAPTDHGLGAPLVRREVIAPGAECENGGVGMLIGADQNGDAELADGEITTREVECYPTREMVSRVEPRGADADCRAGSIVLAMGRDANGNGVLDPPEIESRETYCVRAPLQRLVPLTAADGCTGVRVLAGFDGDGDGVLDDDEVTTHSDACGEVTVGDVLLRTEEDVARAAGVVAVLGHVFIAAGDVELPALRFVQGVVEIQSFDGRRVALPALEEAGAVEALGAASLETLDLSSLVRVEGGLDVQDDPTLRTLRLARSLERARFARFANLPALESLDVNVDGPITNLEVTELPHAVARLRTTRQALVALRGELGSVDANVAGGTAFAVRDAHITGAMVVSASGGSVTLAGVSGLTKLGVRAHALPVGLSVEGNPDLETVEVEGVALETVTVENAPALRALTMPAPRGVVRLVDLPALRHVHAPRFLDAELVRVGSAEAPLTLDVTRVDRLTVAGSSARELELPRLVAASALELGGDAAPRGQDRLRFLRAPALEGPSVLRVSDAPELRAVTVGPSTVLRSLTIERSPKFSSCAAETLKACVPAAGDVRISGTDATEPCPTVR